jgi:GntR family transcriptional regulator
MTTHAAVDLPAFAGPLYVQVASILRAKICAMEWTARAPLPNEVALARDIGVSIGTVRKALEMLENERLIQRRQGRGTFVVETSDDTELERFSNLVSGSKKLKSNPVTWSYSLGEATQGECQALALQLSERVYRVETVWAAGDMATVAETVIAAEVRFPGLHNHLDQAGQYLFPLYRRHYQEVITKVTEVLRPVIADSVLAAQLMVGIAQPLLQVDRIAFAMSGGPIELSRRTMHLARSGYSVTML